jgi:CubicO group peptidase (beta-lactamase class C family)
MPLNFGKYVKDPANPYADYPVEAMYEFINNYKLTRKPGDKFEYSNLAVGILGNLLVKIDEKKDYEELVQERILKPIGMINSTAKLSKIDKSILAKPHSSGNEVKNWDIPSMEGAGAIKSDAKDMLRYIKALVENTNPEILPEKMFTEITTMDKDVYMCFNWAKVHRPDGSKVFSHRGGTGGYTTHIIFDKDNKAGVIILTNDSEDTGEAAYKVLQILLKKYDKPELTPNPSLKKEGNKED